MAVGTPYLCKSGASFLTGGCGWSGSGRGQHPHEVGKGLDVGKDRRVRIAARRGSRREVERVLRSGVKDTAWRFVAFLLEKLVCDAHLDVVCLAGEYEQGFVLCLPPETRNASIVCTAVHVSAQVSVRVPGNTQCRLLRRLGPRVRKDGRVWNRFDEPRAKHRSRDPENNVRIPTLARKRISRGPEVELGDVATGGVRSPGDHEEVVHFAVGRPAGAVLAPRFA